MNKTIKQRIIGTAHIVRIMRTDTRRTGIPEHRYFVQWDNETLSRTEYPKLFTREIEGEEVEYICYDYSHSFVHRLKNGAYVTGPKNKILVQTIYNYLVKCKELNKSVGWDI